MNKRQLEVQKAAIQDEKKIIRQLQRVYNQAAKDCQQKINNLAARQDLQNIQSIVYQQQYQQALKKQLEGILDMLQSNSFTDIAGYLQGCYENGFIGTLYDLQGQGIPLILPIDQRQVVKALQTDAKLSKGMYARLGEDIDYLKKSIRAELSRGISNGSTWFDIAHHIANGMNSPFKTALYNSIRIARTEGHRIQNQAQWDSVNKAKDKGADIVKQWDATLDKRTRPTHRRLDGQIRELDEPFEVNGHKAMYPGGFGVAKEDIHCRCCMLQRAKWALDEDELQTLKDRAAYFELDKSKDFEDFKGKYLKLPANAATIKIGTLDKPVDTEDEHYKRVLELVKKAGVDYKAVETHTKQLSDQEIIDALSGGDLTTGSCASLGLAYIGQKQGWNILDFRGGSSQDFFASYPHLNELIESDGIKYVRGKGACSTTVGNSLLKQCEVGKEYYLCVGQHAAIVRKVDDGTKKGKYQYLELQSARNSGWTDFDGNARYTLSWRFGTSSTSNHYHQNWAFMIDIDESDFSTDEFKSVLGYINTDESKQQKGVSGSVK